MCIRDSLHALRKMGVRIAEDYGCLSCSVDGSLRGAAIGLSFPSVGATENIMLAAVLAEGTTIVTNAAREPEICDLAMFLNRCGARIRGAGESTLVIEGVRQLHGCEHRVIPDRIVAATYMLSLIHISLWQTVPRSSATPGARRKPSSAWRRSGPAPW